MILLPGLLWILTIGIGGEPPRLETKSDKLGIPYERYLTKDALGRAITFYLSTPPGKEATAKLPVVLIIQGSGCQSLFRKVGQRVGGGFQNLLLEEAKGRARILAVEKPGVKYLDDPPPLRAVEGASEEFLHEHTLSRWAEANIAALRAVWTLADVDPDRTLVVGHSEGGLVAARVAAELPTVTHVASLAGGGPTQLFDFVSNNAQPRPDDKPGDGARRVQSVYDEWAKIQNDPDSISRFWLGHPYRRWSSFLRYSVTDELLRAKARIYAAHGIRDAVIPVAAHDMLVSELRARGRDVTEERLEGADHGFRTEDMLTKGPPLGMKALLGRVLEWFFAQAGKAKRSTRPGSEPAIGRLSVSPELVGIRRRIMTADQFRKMALSLPEASESAHMGHPDFRVRKKIFATLWPDESWGVVKLTPEQQERFVQAEPDVFVPVAGAWGGRGATHVHLASATDDTVRPALIAAWRNVAPKRLAREYETGE